MTEFEQAVAGALHQLLYEMDSQVPVICAIQLAPRVAAAIAAAISEAARSFGGPYGPTEDAGDAPERAALAALRGEVA